MASNSLRRAQLQLDAAAYLICPEVMDSLQFPQRQAFYHAALAAHVATWNAFVRAVLVEYYGAFQTIGDQRLSQFAVITRGLLDKELKKFNTPNFENSRDLIVVTTGYDPFNVWCWPRRGLTPNQLNSYLNQVLKVRHAFAHGASMPAYDWTTKPNGTTRLTKASVDQVAGLIQHLCKVTDKELSEFFARTYATQVPW